MYGRGFLIDVLLPHPPEEERARQDPMYTIRMLNPETRATLEALREEEKGKKTVSPGKEELLCNTDWTHCTLQEKKESKGKEKATSRNAVSWQLIVFFTLSPSHPLTLSPSHPLTLPPHLSPSHPTSTPGSLLHWCCCTISDLHCHCSSHRE